MSTRTRALLKKEGDHMLEGDLEYFERRMAEEQAEAEKATRPDVRTVHVKLSAMYESRIAGLKGKAPSKERSSRVREVGVIQALMDREN